MDLLSMNFVRKITVWLAQPERRKTQNIGSSANMVQRSRSLACFICKSLRMKSSKTVGLQTYNLFHTMSFYLLCHQIPPSLMQTFVSRQEKSSILSYAEDEGRIWVKLHIKERFEYLPPRIKKYKIKFYKYRYQRPIWHWVAAHASWSSKFMVI